MLYSDFPVIEYPYLTDTELKTKLATDILIRIGYNEDLKNNEQIFTYYRVKDGETPEIISDKIYGTPDYHWIILLFNDVIDPYYEWTLSSQTMDNYLREKYPGTSLYISSTDDDNAQMITYGFYQDQTIYKTNGTLQSNGIYDIIDQSRAVVYGWNKTNCELIVDQNEGNFGVGDLIAGIGPSGDAVIAKVNRVQDRYSALHHFEKKFTSGSSGPTGDSIFINPLSEAAGLSAGENQIIGSTLGFNGNVTLKDTFIGVYMGVTGAVTNNNFAVSNLQYENDRNFEVGRIKLIRPQYIRQLPRSLKELTNG